MVITGIGVITAAGTDVSTFWGNVVAGRGIATTITRFDPSALPIRIASEVRGFEPTRYMSPAKARRFDPAIVFSVAAAKQAVADSGLELGRANLDRISVVEGTAVCGFHNAAEGILRFDKGGYRSIQPTRIVNAFAGGGSSEIAIEMGFTGQATTIATACSSGNDAMAYAAHAIQDDLVDVAVAGATEAPLVAPFYSLFIQCGVLSRRNDDPTRAMRPFDRDRDGFVFGEGATFLVLEELTHALARGARIYCEWKGVGQSCDAYDSVKTHPEGRAMKRALEKALYASEVPVDAIDYINCHGSATETNELIETNIYKTVLGARARKVAISGTKPVTGHLMGATGALEAAICALTVFHGTIPPTPNLENLMEGCDLDYVPGAARSHPVRNALNVNLSFGGKTTAAVFTRYDGQ